MRALLPLLLLCGCAPAEAWVEVGQGAGAFAPLLDGDRLLVERGSQGGQHVWVGLRAEGLEPGSLDPAEAALRADRPLVELALWGADGRYSLDHRLRRALAPTDDGPCEATDLLLQLRHFAELPDDWQSVDWRERERRLEELDFLLELRVVDAEGVEATDSREVRLDFPDPVDFPDAPRPDLRPPPR